MCNVKSWFKLYVLLFGRITALVLGTPTRVRLSQWPVHLLCDCSSADMKI